MTQEYLTVQEAAELLRVAPGTVRRWIGKGQILSIRIGNRIRIPKGNVISMTPHEFLTTDEFDIPYDTMTDDEQDAYRADIILEMNRVQERIRAVYGKVEDSVDILDRARELDTAKGSY